VGLSLNPGGADDNHYPVRCSGSIAPVFISTDRLALAGFLAGNRGLTRDSYELDLRQFTGWCQQHHVRLFQARRADIECFARDLEACGRASATITRRLCTAAGFYRYAVEEELHGLASGITPGLSAGLHPQSFLVPQRPLVTPAPQRPRRGFCRISRLPGIAHFRRSGGFDKSAIGR